MLVVSFLDEAVYAERVLRAGASGYLSKLQPIDEVLFAFETLLAGDLYLSRQTAALMAGRIFAAKSNTSSGIENLSDRELQVFHLIGAGLTSRKISEELRIRLKTVEAHREHIKRKLGISCVSDLIGHATSFAQGDTYLQATSTAVGGAKRRTKSKTHLRDNP